MFSAHGLGLQTSRCLMCAAEVMEITSAVWLAPLGDGRGRGGQFFVFVFIFFPVFVELVAGEQNAV